LIDRRLQMAQDFDDIMRLFSKSEDLLEMIRKGRAFTEDLMCENERLRYRIVQIETEKIDLSDALSRQVELLQTENTRMSQKLEFLDRRFKEVEAENKDFAQRYVEVEEHNESLANLYVASYRLHSTLDPGEVIECIKEVIVNMVGSEEFGLFIVDEETKELVLAGYEGEIARTFENRRLRFGEGMEGAVAESGEMLLPHGNEASKDIKVCVPLRIKDRVVGVIAMYRLLPHKKRLTGLDFKLLELLAGHAATALVSSKLYSQADRRLRTMEGVMSLLRER
jgi:nitrate/nitrite-specific signal transduction histidine kinase